MLRTLVARGALWLKVLFEADSQASQITASGACSVN